MISWALKYHIFQENTTFTQNIIERTHEIERTNTHTFLSFTVKHKKAIFNLLYMIKQEASKDILC